MKAKFVSEESAMVSSLPKILPNKEENALLRAKRLRDEEEYEEFSEQEPGPRE